MTVGSTGLEDVDAATERLYREIVESPVHGPFIRRVDEIRSQASRAPLTSPPVWNRDAVLAIVPGVSYRENPRSGADGRLLREQAERMGCRTDLIPIATTGSVKENARTICDWLGAQGDRQIILASLSKGGPDVKVALAEPNPADAAHAFRNVVAWVSLCGILDGTPIADWLLSRSLGPNLIRFGYLLLGQKSGFLRDLLYRSGGPLAAPLRLPEHIRLISIVGFPQRKHLNRRASRSGHERLSRYGPNDGGLVLSDVCALPGLLYPIWGADHYLQPPPDVCDVRALVAAILQYLGQYLDETLDP